MKSRKQEIKKQLNKERSRRYRGVVPVQKRLHVPPVGETCPIEFLLRPSQEVMKSNFVEPESNGCSLYDDPHHAQIFVFAVSSDRVSFLSTRHFEELPSL